jgi:hypothetical protein
VQVFGKENYYEIFIHRKSDDVLEASGFCFLFCFLFILHWTGHGHIATWGKIFRLKRHEKQSEGKVKTNRNFSLKGVCLNISSISARSFVRVLRFIIEHRFRSDDGLLFLLNL